jgi:Uma2 family endonuclease
MKGLFSHAVASMVCVGPRFHDKHQYILLNLKLMVEVLPPSTEALDRGGKFARYAVNLKNFTDYLLASTATPRFEHFAREKASRWVYTSVEGFGGG